MIASKDFIPAFGAIVGLFTYTLAVVIGSRFTNGSASGSKRALSRSPLHRKWYLARAGSITAGHSPEPMRRGECLLWVLCHEVTAVQTAMRNCTRILSAAQLRRGAEIIFCSLIQMNDAFDQTDS